MVEKKFADNERECGTLKGMMKLKVAEAERCAGEVQKKKLLIEELRNENLDLREKLNAKAAPTTREDLRLQ